MTPIDPDALHLAREFRADPFGRHSPGLTHVLNVMRSDAMAGKYCLVCTRPHQEWRLAVLSAERGVAPAIAHNRVFHSLAEAEWAVFKLRWKAITGREILDHDQDPAGL
jgi:hypothetical protein